MQDFEVVRPENLNNVLVAIKDGEGVPIAGGTDLLVRIKKKLLTPKKLIDLSGLTELAKVKNAGEYIIIGAMTTHAQVLESVIVRKHLPLLVQGCATVGSPQIRNAGTLGGNIMNASPPQIPYHHW